jgi:predicted RND superfamily exporter protein
MAVCELEVVSTEGDSEAAARLNEIRRGVVGEIYAVIDRERTNPRWGADVEFHAASATVMMVELERRARQVAFRFLPAAILVGLASLLWGFRSWRALAAAVGGAAVAMLLVLGATSALGGSLGVVTMVSPTLMSIFAIASSVHFASYAAEHTHADGAERRAALVRAVAVPCLGAAGTTGIGFLMLCFNQLGPVRDLGLQLFLGSLLAFFGVFLVSQRLPVGSSAPGIYLTHQTLRRYARFATSRPRITLAVMAMLCSLAVFAAWPRPKDKPIGLYVDADAFSFFSDDQPISRALAHFGKRQFGLYQLDVVLIPVGSDQSGYVVDPKSERYALDEAASARFSDAVENEGRELGIVRVLSTQSFRHRAEQFDVELERVRNEQGTGAWVAALPRYAAKKLAFETTFRNWNTDKREQGAQRLTFLAANQGAQGFRPLVELVERHIPRDRFECHISGSIADSLNLAEGLTQGIAQGLLASLVLTVGLCVLLFRSVRLAIIALPPNLLPIVAFFGLMGLCKIPVSSGSAMVATVALGIALNDTIHFILHYKYLTRVAGWSTEAAVRSTLEELGRPIVLTSVVHIAGFAIFLLTDFQPLFHFGLLANVCMVSALAGDLVMLPNLLLVFDRRPGIRPASGEPSPLHADTLAMHAAPAPSAVAEAIAPASSPG